MLKVWLVNGVKFLREFDIGMEVKKMVVCLDDKCCFVDIKGELKVMYLFFGIDVEMDLLSYVLDFVIGKDGVIFYIIGLK